MTNPTPPKPVKEEPASQGTGGWGGKPTRPPVNAPGWFAPPSSGSRPV